MWQASARETTYCRDGVGSDQGELQSEIEHVRELCEGDLAEDVVRRGEGHLGQGLLRGIGRRRVRVFAADVAEKVVAEQPDEYQV